MVRDFSLAFSKLTWLVSQCSNQGSLNHVKVNDFQMIFIGNSKVRKSCLGVRLLSKLFLVLHDKPWKLRIISTLVRQGLFPAFLCLPWLPSL